MSEEFNVTCYMAWSGTEATFPFDSKEEFDLAKAFLERVSIAHIPRNQLPPGFAPGAADYYCVEPQYRDAFWKVMGRSNKASG